MQYVQQVFIHAGASVEDVEKVCDIVELFICADCIKPGKMFRIPYNKKLRNAETTINVIAEVRAWMTPDDY